MPDQRGIGNGRQQHAELIAADAADGGIARRCIAQAPGHALQDDVALGMPVHIVEGTEIVDADQQQCAAGHRLSLQARLQPLQKPLAIVNAGQRIEIRAWRGTSRLRAGLGHHPCPICNCRHCYPLAI
ncbi:hypothetical protein D3C72_1638790 [compost metagenome]